MKKTLTVNISGIAFSIDEDAYQMLSAYLEDIEFRLKAQHEDSETMRDIETRIMEIFRERGASEYQVVDIELVKHVISAIGNPSVFGDRNDGTSQAPRTEYKFIAKRLLRNPTDKMIGGVCSGLASYYGLEVSLLRIALFITMFFWGISLWIYIILWIVIPIAQTQEEIDMLNRSKNRR